MANAVGVESETTEDVEELAAQCVHQDGALPGPLGEGEVGGFGYRFAVLQETLVDVVAKVSHRFAGDLLADFEWSLIRTGHDGIDHVLRFFRSRFDVSSLVVAGMMVFVVDHGFLSQ